MIFEFKAIDKNGKKINSFISADDKTKAIQKLQEKKYVINWVKEKKYSDKSDQALKLPIDDKIFFTKNLGSMIAAGLTVNESLEIFKAQAETKKTRYLLTRISQSIQGGKTLAQSMIEFRTVFDPIYTSMIESGEVSGNLDSILKYLYAQQKKEQELTNQIKNALIYPIIILSLTLGIALFLLIFILPKITKIFTSFNLDLPLPTKILIGTSNFLLHRWYVLLVAAIFIFFGFRWLMKRNIIKPVWHNLILKIFIVGKIARTVNLARFFRVFSTLLKSGIPIVKALEITAETLPNVVFKQVLSEICLKIEKGGSLSTLFEEKENLFPILTAKMIEIGDKIGTLPKACENLAEGFEDDVSNMTKNLSALMEPFLLLLMGFMVAGIAISVILPIYKIPGLMQSR